MSRTDAVATSLPGRLADVLRRLTAPLLTGRNDVSALACAGDAAEWLWRAPDCPLPAEASPRDLPRDGWQRVHLASGSQAVDVWLNGRLPAGLAPVICLASEIADLEEDREGLCEELSASHESLASLFDLTTDPSLLMDPERALNLIVDRAIGWEPGLRAVIWSRADDRLVPLCASGRDVQPRARAAGIGILGRVVATGQSQVDNACTASASEPELAAARRVAASPLASSSGVIGALEVWHDAPGPALDSRFLGLLRSLGAQAAMLLDHDRLHREHLATNRLRQELDIASRIQESLLVGRTPDAPPGLEVGAVAVPSRRVDGDFYEFFAHGEVTDLIVGDVMGKGLPAALVSAAVKSRFLRFAATDGLAVPSDTLPSPAEVVARVHEDVGDRLLDLECFVTALYARIDPRRRCVETVDCGHVPLLHFRAGDGSVQELRRDWPGPTNLPLGVAPEARYEAVEVAYDPGDVLVFYSDGMTEARAPNGAMFGVAALADALHDAAPMTAPAIARRLRDAVLAFSGERGLSDDLTCVVVKALEARTPTPATEETATPSPASARPRTFAAALSAVSEVRVLLQEATVGLEISPEAAYELQLAAVEITSNIARHAFPADAPGAFTLAVAVGHDAVALSFEDDGRPFDPRDAPRPDLDAAAEGGLGLHLVHTVMDTVEYERTPHGTNRLRLRKKL